nr:unnamed protein product [Digitaria exilis]
MNAFRQIRFAGGEPPSPATKGDGGDEWGPILPRTYTLTSWQMRQSFYRKVVLSADSQSAMLILDRIFGSPAFATAEDAAWRLAPSHHGGVEDAIHHRGQFFSITNTGVVETWARDDVIGQFTSTVHARAGHGRKRRRRKAPAKDVPNPEWTHEMITRVSFKVLVLDEARRRWEEVEEIGGAAVFVGVNASVCVAAKEHKGIMPNCVYFTEDDVAQARIWHEEEERRSYYAYREPKDGELRNVGVYSLKRGKVDKINHPTSWPPPVWFTPSLL